MGAMTLVIGVSGREGNIKPGNEDCVLDTSPLAVAARDVLEDEE
jgi:hypothetical protein